MGKKQMTRLVMAALAGLAVTAAAPAVAQQAPAAAQPSADAPWPEAWFEIFKLAPGKHEEFVRGIARSDEIAKAGGQPPTQMFFHENGGDWDVLLFKPVTNHKPTPAQQAAMDAKRKELRMESGPAYFVRIRESIASHDDTKAYGPVSAEQWLARLDKWRRENPPR